MRSSSIVRIDCPVSNELSGFFIYRKLIGQMPLRLSSPKYSQLPNANLPALIFKITERRSSSPSNLNHRTPFFQPYPLGIICPLCPNLISSQLAIASIFSTVQHMESWLICRFCYKSITWTQHFPTKPPKINRSL
jgi:hypothetical protein